MHDSSSRDVTYAVSRRQLLKASAAGLASAPWWGKPLMAAQRRPAEPTATIAGSVSGTCHWKFQRVHDEFVRNFEERGEVGASVCVIVNGRTMVDLWGGTARPETNTPWVADTLCHVWSATKGATALCAHILVDRGLLDLDAPVARYWPEFGQAGKEGITVAMLLCHQAGLPAIRQMLPQGAFYDWDFMVNALAAETPFWEPGTRNGYHALTFGFLVGELVRRVSGQSLGAFFRDEVAAPLDLDFWIGLPETEEPRVAPLLAADGLAPGETLSVFLRKALTEPASIPGLIFYNSGGYMFPGEADTRAAHAAEIGAAGGITNARGLARMYAQFATRLPEVELVGADTIARMSRVASASGQDAVGFIPTRFSLGYVKSMDNRAQPPGMQDSVILGEEAFGHSGFGGSVGFADPRANLSFGYAMNKMGLGTALNVRGQSLVDAAYESIGCASDASGSWTGGSPRCGARRYPLR
jgi:CubicO group peptidase (beta-lactamase class C family)